MSTPLRLATALLVPLLLLAGCGDDEPEKSDSTSEPSIEPSSEPTDAATTESTEATESESQSASAEPTDEASDPPTVAESATPQAGDDCTLLPTADVTAAFEEEMSLIGAGAQTCVFNAASGSENGVTLNLIALQIDQDEYADGTRDTCEGKIRKVRAGDEAFTCLTSVGPQGFLFEHDYSVVLDVGASDDAAALELAGALLPSVIVP
jgi:hypothetical protein